MRNDLLADHFLYFNCLLRTQHSCLYTPASSCREASGGAAPPPYHHRVGEGPGRQARAQEPSQPIAREDGVRPRPRPRPHTGFHVSGWNESSKGWLNIPEFTGSIFTTATKENPGFFPLPFSWEELLSAVDVLSVHVRTAGSRWDRPYVTHTSQSFAT